MLYGCASQPTQIALLATDNDQKLAYQTLQQVLETQISGTTRSWRNTNNDHVGSITPIRTFKTSNGIFCRVYAETLTIHGKTQKFQETACRDKDGIWKVI